MQNFLKKAVNSYKAEAPGGTSQQGLNASGGLKIVEYKVVIGAKDGKSHQKELKGAEAESLHNKRIGETISGDPLGFAGYEFLITGGSDKSGFPLRKGIQAPRWSKKLNGFVTYGYFGKSRKEVDKVVKKYNIGNKISTALIESFNQKIRDSLAYMTRRSSRIPRLLEWAERALKGLRFYRNYIKPSLPLSFKSSKNWIQWAITPAMEVGLTNKPLTIEEVLCHPTFN